MPCVSRPSAEMEASRQSAAHAGERPVIVLDFGAQYSQLIARRVRECRVFSELRPHDTPIEELRRRDPRALILSGGPASVNAPGAPSLDPAVLELGVPVLGICYGMQALALALGGTVSNTGRGEYGKTALADTGGVLFADLPDATSCWMSHFDS